MAPFDSAEYGLAHGRPLKAEYCLLIAGRFVNEQMGQLLKARHPPDLN